MRGLRWRLAFALLPAAVLAAGCHSYQVDSTVENRTGEAIKLLEVDYPSASYGTNFLPAGANYSYRFQIRDSGPIKVQYTETKTLKVRHIQGPDLQEGQEGHIEIVLMPGGQADFHAVLNSKP